MPRRYLELRVRAAIDSGELAAELANTGLLGASEEDGSVCLYWPSESWRSGILDSLGRLLRERDIAIDAATFSLEVLPDRDWNTLWAQSVKPIRIGSRLLIRQSWNPVDVQPGVIELVVDPKRAFGTGFHSTTQLLLEWLEEVVRGRERVLDIGTGSGILAMAAVRLGAAFALGIDSDSEAVECALENAAANGFGAELQFRLENLERIEAHGYDIVIANLDRNTLLRSAREVTLAVGHQGRLCVSGIQAEDFADISSVFAEHGGRISGEWQRDEWLALEIHFEPDKGSE